MIQVKARHELVTELRPRQKGLVFNATRPIVGHDQQTGEMKEGRFYATVYPGREDTEYLIKRIVDYDGYLIVQHLEDDVREDLDCWYASHFSEKEIDVYKYDIEPVWRSWLLHCASKVVWLDESLNIHS